MEDVFIVLIGVPTIIFMTIVAPIWLILHYRSKRSVEQGLTEEQYQTMRMLAEQAEKMSERIHTLEAILDAEAPKWRDKV